jgi:hypothetical protein
MTAEHFAVPLIAIMKTASYSPDTNKDKNKGNCNGY